MASASGDDADEPDARARIIDGADTRRGTRDLDRSPARAGDPLPRGPERGLGLEPIPQEGYGSNLVIAHWADDPARIQKHLLANGIMISGGLDPTMGKAIRVGLMGRTATDAMVDRMLAGVKEALTS